MRRLPLASTAKPTVFVLALTPFVFLVYTVLSGQIGPNPIDELTDQTGTLALRMLLISLALTPLRHVLKNTWPLRFRRMMGLFAFFYAFVHVMIYAVLDQQLDLQAIISDIAERPYVLAGTTAFILLIPLALSSTKAMIRRLGKNWLLLHRAVYVASTAAVVHYVWLARGDRLEPYVYLAILLILFSFRLVRLMR